MFSTKAKRLKIWRKENPEKVRAHNRTAQSYRATWTSRWQKANRGIANARYRRWYARKGKAKFTQKRHTDIAFRLRQNVSSRVRHALKIRCAAKLARAIPLLGCSVMELRVHLEGQFKKGMSWENYGCVWHIDHRTPCAYFDLTRYDEQRRCFHFTNLRPLWAKKNLQRGARAGAVQQEFMIAIR